MFLFLSDILAGIWGSYLFLCFIIPLVVTGSGMMMSLPVVLDVSTNPRGPLDCVVGGRDDLAETTCCPSVGGQGGALW